MEHKPAGSASDGAGQLSCQSATGADVEGMTLKELKKAVQEGRREAMLRWARLDPEEATPWLAKLIEDVKENCGSAFNDQRGAASALARIGDARGLAWLARRPKTMSVMMAT